MTELRTDFLTGDHVVIAPNRANRPMGFERLLAANKAGETSTQAASTVSRRQEESADMRHICPFCPENEHMTPGITSRIGQVRAVPNLYPAFEHDAGRHEVIIDTPIHNEKLQELTPDQITNILMMIKDRYLAFMSDGNIKQVQAFKNDGVIAGASIPHSHWQITGIPFVPDLHKTMLSNFAAYKAKNGSCYICDIADKPDEDNELFVFRNSGAVAYVPYAPQFSYMLNILPLKHISNIGELDEETAGNMGQALKMSLSALIKTFPTLEYNILLHSSPPYEKESEKWHFFMQIIPRQGFLAGYELLTGCYINSVFPENAAKKIRGCL